MNKFFKKQKAFTLAETLITLMVIGVVAALTIPNLFHNYKKNQIETGLKEAYSILSNTLKMAQANTGEDFSDMVHLAFSKAANNEDIRNIFAENYLVPYLKAAKTCRGTAAATVSDCGIFDSWRLIDRNNNMTTVYASTTYRILLSNGMYLATYTLAPGMTVPEIIYFIVDVNGGKSPNKVGADIFYFSLSSNVCNHSNSYYCGKKNIITAAGFETQQSIDNNKNRLEECITECSGYIMQNGWKIPDNYPVKNF